MITKYTNCEVIEVKSADEKLEGNAKLSSFDHIPNDVYRTKDGYIYVKVRAISSRVNKNFDGWPVNELAGVDEDDFRNLGGETIKSSGSKDVTKFFKQISKDLGFEINKTKHYKITHPEAPGKQVIVAATPTNDKYQIRRTISQIKKNFPEQWGDYQWFDGSRGKKSSTDNQLTFTKDSSLKFKGDYGFKTFIGRPVFVDHNNSDPQRARGVVVDAMLHIEPSHKISADSYWSSAPENHTPETWIELLLEVDGKAFPKLAKALTSGQVNAVSMGCNVEYTLCSVCNNKAASVDEYCDHIKKKGTTFKTGNISKVAYEDCYNVNFFEISAVFDPADVTALFTEPIIKDAHAAVEHLESVADRFKEGGTETKELEQTLSKTASIEKEAYGEAITSPNKIDTLKAEKPCPIGLAGECGLDEESGRCEKCGYREPPAPLDDPDLSKAKAFDREKEKQKNESRNDTKSLIDKLKQTLSRNEQRSVNSKMNNTEPNITLTANVKGVPSDTELAELGWTIPEKEAGAAANTTAIADDGQTASDEPRDKKVISDQTKPVESATKVALGEMPGLNQPNGGESTPQYKGDKNNESSGINEHQPEVMAEQYQSIKHPEEEPQFADEGNSKGIKQHNPSTMPEQYEGVKKVDEKPQFSGEGGTKGISEHHAAKAESSVLSALKLADLEVELGLNDAEMKYARVAELENEDPAIITAKYETLSKIKEAGLTSRKEASSKKLASFPSMKGIKESSVTSTASSSAVPDDAIFN